jgi:peroxiredoxin
MLGVDIQESTDIVRDFAQQYGAQYPIVIDTKGDVTKQYRVIGLPATWFIDSNGIIRALFLGQLTPDLIAKKLGEAGFAEAKKP